VTAGDLTETEKRMKERKMVFDVEKREAMWGGRQSTGRQELRFLNLTLIES